MENNYSYWRVLRAQWSWKNDKFGILMDVIIAAAVTLFYFLSGSITITATPEFLYVIGVLVFFAGQVIWLALMYHTLKLLILGSILLLVCYEAKKGNSKAVAFYNEALTWRQ